MSEQPAPTPNASTPIIDLIESWLPPGLRPVFRARAEIGRERYGVLLQAGNGRDALRDALDELIDGPMYLLQGIEEETSPLDKLVLMELLAHVLQSTERVRLFIERRDGRRAETRRPAAAAEHVPARLILYVAHPLAPLPADVAADELHPEPRSAALEQNLRRAMRWLSWLRRSFPEVTFVAPWIAAVMSGEDDSDPKQREAGLIDDCAVVERCDGIVLVGGRISSGMAREREHARRCWDLTGLGKEPPRDCEPLCALLVYFEQLEVRP